MAGLQLPQSTELYVFELYDGKNEKRDATQSTWYSTFSMLVVFATEFALDYSL